MEFLRVGIGILSCVVVCTAQFTDETQIYEKECLGEDRFQCLDGGCIWHHQYCDGMVDCADSSDENLCLELSVPLTKEECEKLNKFPCEDGHRCLPKGLVCNGEKECNDGSDEVNCIGHTVNVNDTCVGFRCKSDGKCISEVWMCDGRYDCDDHSDEDVFDACQHVMRDNFTRDSIQLHPVNNCYQCADHSYCLPRSRMCDGVADCRDGGDEGPFCQQWPTMCKNHTCDGTAECRPEREGPTCACELYHNYNSTSGKCEPFNSCLDPDPACSQICVYLNGPFHCRCEEGYTIDYYKIGVGCFAPDPEGRMYYNTENEIRSIGLKSKHVRVEASRLKQPHGVAFDGKYLYWGETAAGHQAIVRAQAGNVAATKETIVSLGLEDPGSLDVDWLGGNVYFTDTRRGLIFACTANGSSCTTIRTTAKRPRHITLHVKKGNMYWIDFIDRSVIMAARMDGSNATILTDKLRKYATSLALDAPNDRLYFIDGALNAIGTEGSGGRIFTMFDHPLHRPFAVSVFENSVFFSDWTTDSILALRKMAGLQHRDDIYQVNATVSSLYIYHPILMKAKTNPCENHTCSHMCLLTSESSYVCGCPDGMELKGSTNVCKAIDNYRPEYLIVGAQSKLTRIEYNALGNPEAHATEFDIHRVQAMAYDSVRGIIYIFDSLLKKLHYVVMGDFKKGHPEVLLKYGLTNVIDMDIDYVTSVLYILDSARTTLDIVSLKTLKRAILMRFDEIPISMCVLPDYGKLLVALKDPIDNRIRIDSIGLDGSDRKTIVTNDLKGPHIHLRYAQNMDNVYIADELNGMIDYMHPEGTGRENFRELSTTVTGLAVTDTYVFWTDRHSTRLYWADIHDTATTVRRMDLSIFPNSSHLYLQATNSIPTNPIVDHPCNQNPCEDICLQTPHTPHAKTYHYKCKCSPGTMDLDGKCVDLIDCKEDQAFCHFSNQCMEKYQICDGVKDCTHGEDEQGCHILSPLEPMMCYPHQYLCNGTCIDHGISCMPATSESNCSESQFDCHNGKICIDRSQVCDGFEDCPDASDEADSTCSLFNCLETEFKCSSGQCIFGSFRCDGEVECVDGSDEFGCINASCKTDQFKCVENQNCIEIGQLCDGQQDCADGSDEAGCEDEFGGHKPDFVEGENCAPWEFPCDLDRSLCLPLTLRCNGKTDCPGNTDELNCHRDLFCYNGGQFRCHEEKVSCIDMRKVCDGKKDCTDTSDESFDSCLLVNRTLKRYPMVYKEECRDGYHCANEQCIEWQAVCDNNLDCTDGSDEANSCATACENNPCAQTCQQTPKGPVCRCPPGFEVGRDGHSCVDVDECQSDACSQRCYNTAGSFLCSCYRGYVLRSDRRTCKATKGHMSFLYVSRNSVRSITTDGYTTVEYTDDSSGEITDMDYNFRLRKLYITVAEAKKLVEVNSTQADVVITNVGRPTKLAVDWVTNNVYFVDSTPSARYMRVCNVQHTLCARLQKLPNAEVTALVVDPAHRRMFYCLTKDLESIIWSATLAGGAVREIANVHQCSGLAVDSFKQLLYVAESGPADILRMDYGGGQLQKLASNDPHLQAPRGLAIFEDHVYFLVANTFKLSRCQLYGSKSCQNHLQRVFDANTFIIKHESVQRDDVEDDCKYVQCENICVLDEPAAVCLCDDGSVETDSLCPTLNVSMLPRFNGWTHEELVQVPRVPMTLAIILSILLVLYGVVVVYYLKRRKDQNRLPYAHVHFQNTQTDSGMASPLSFGDLSSPGSSAVDMPLTGSSRQEFVNPLQRIRDIWRRSIHRSNRPIGTAGLQVNIPSMDNSQATDLVNVSDTESDIDDRDKKKMVKN